MSWQRQLLIHLERHKRYPNSRAGKGAHVVVGFELDRRGRVSKATIVKGSGDAAFDQAALEMMKRADPVPAPPPLVADEGLTFNVPVAFRIRR
jgi:TonB family protein